MVLIGIPKGPLHVENVLTDVVFKSLTLKTVHGQRYNQHFDFYFTYCIE